MKKLIALVLLALLGFYVAWPAWSAYTLGNALMSGDEATVARKIDFTSVRISLKPVVEKQVEQEMYKQLAQVGGGMGAAIGGNLKKQMMPQLVDMVLGTVVTPTNVIRITRQGGNAAGTVRQIVDEQMGKIGGAMTGLGGGGGSGGGIKLPGGLGGLAGAAGVALPGLGGLGGGSSQPAAPAPAPAAKASAPAAGDKKPSFGFGNIKGFGFDGPTGLSVSVAKDAGSSKPDVTAGMRFTGFDWKVTKVIPHL